MSKTIFLEIKDKSVLSDHCTIEGYLLDEKSQKQSTITTSLSGKNKVIELNKEWRYILEEFLNLRKKIRKFKNNKISQENLKTLNTSYEDRYSQTDKNKEKFLKAINHLLNNNELDSWLKLQIGNNKDTCNIVIKTNSLELGSIPWEHCDIFSPYYQTNDLNFGVYFSKDENKNEINSSQKIENPVVNCEKVTKVLVILGEEEIDNNQEHKKERVTSEVNYNNKSKQNNHKKINLNVDEEEFLNLENTFKNLENRAKVEITIERPNLNELKNLLKPERNWDVIYYGGHSRTITSEQDGMLHLKGGTEVKISELENDFEHLIKQGSLKLLISNSCQNLGTGFRLTNIGLPYAIVMRESVPDDFAHEYLKYLLESIAIGLPLSYAMQYSRPYLREAFDRGHKIPGASMFPVLCLTPDYINQLDQPIIPIEGLGSIGGEMKSLANLAKSRLLFKDYKDETAIALQRFYADMLKEKNIVSNKGIKKEIDPRKIKVRYRMSGKLIWQITMYADVSGEELIWGQGFVNIETGHSELLLDNRPFSWKGIPVIIQGEEIAQVKIPKEATVTVNNGKIKKLSVTKLAILIMEQHYKRFYESKEGSKYSSAKKNISNFGGWLKDFNRRIFQKEFAVLAVKNDDNFKDEDITAQAFIKTSFGNNRQELGITEFEIDTFDENGKVSWKTLKYLIENDNWDEKDQQYLKDNNVSEDSWEQIRIPNKIIVTEAKRPEEESNYPEIKTSYQEQEFKIYDYQLLE